MYSQTNVIQQNFREFDAQIISVWFNSKSENDLAAPTALPWCHSHGIGTLSVWNGTCIYIYGQLTNMDE